MNGNNPTLMRAIRGPIMLITIGSLFAFDHMTEQLRENVASLEVFESLDDDQHRRLNALASPPA